MNTVAASAIARSVSQNEIVTIDYDPAAAEDLSAASDGSADGNDVTEYWGTDDDGSEWRVHMRAAAR